MADPYTIGDFIHEQMEQRSIASHNKFAEFMGSSASTVIDIAKGKQKPGLDFLMKLSDATNTDLLLLVQISYPEKVISRQPEPSVRILAERLAKLPQFVRDVIERLIDSYSK